MRLNTDPAALARKPCLRDLHRLTTTLLPPALVALVPLEELARRTQEIDATHPQYREERPWSWPGKQAAASACAACA